MPFGPVEADDRRVLRVVDPEDLLARLAVLPDDGVGDDRVVVPGADQGRAEVVGHVEALETRLDVVVEGLVGQVGVDPDGVAADVGQGHGPQHRTPGRDQAPTGVGVIGVPGGLLRSGRRLGRFLKSSAAMRWMGLTASALLALGWV